MAACPRAQKGAGYGFSIHIQRQTDKRKNFSAAPLYKKLRKRYNRDCNAPVIRLCMEGIAPYAGGRCYPHLFLHCTFRALYPNYTAFLVFVKRENRKGKKQAVFQPDRSPNIQLIHPVIVEDLRKYVFSA